MTVLNQPPSVTVRRAASATRLISENDLPPTGQFIDGKFRGAPMAISWGWPIASALILVVGLSTFSKTWAAGYSLTRVFLIFIGVLAVISKRAD